MATGLGIMIVIELCAFGMGKNYVYQNRQLEENGKK